MTRAIGIAGINVTISKVKLSKFKRKKKNTIGRRVVFLFFSNLFSNWHNRSKCYHFESCRNLKRKKKPACAWREIGDFSLSKGNLFVVYSDGETLADTRLKNSQFRGREKGGDGGGTLETLSIPCPSAGGRERKSSDPTAAKPPSMLSRPFCFPTSQLPLHPLPRLCADHDSNVSYLFSFRSIVFLSFLFILFESRVQRSNFFSPERFHPRIKSKLVKTSPRRRRGRGREEFRGK